MVEGSTAKAYALRIRDEFKNEIVRDIFVKSKRILVLREFNKILYAGTNQEENFSL